MSTLHALAYVSTVSEPLSVAQIEQLAAQAAHKNRRLQLSGLLLYCGGTFMQYLEGPAEALRGCYAAITADPRHHGLILLFESPIAAREFGDWAMGCCEADVESLAVLRAAPWLAAPEAPHPPGRQLLRTFWEKNGPARRRMTVS